MQLLTKRLLIVAEAQFLDIISVNLWNILISLLNLVVLFWLVKKFLFKPVKKMLAERQADIDHQYAAAAEAQRVADENREMWENKLSTADAEAQRMIRDAADTAKHRAAEIVRRADEQADGIVRRAEAEAELERKRAEDGIKREIVGVSTAIAEKMLEREVNEKDHRALIDEFIDKIGESDEGDQ
ncbi:MAG: F0F1 ATP synthase subunit B [Clostridia bacterium]|nr:F0F1 ATP synthase subunit B [Clostridia bacterium]